MTEQYLVKRDFFTWDPKITTPPGLYLIGFVFGELVKLIQGGDSFLMTDEDPTNPEMPNQNYKMNTVRYLNR